MSNIIDLTPIVAPFSAIGEECRAFAASMWATLPGACTTQAEADACGLRARELANKRDEYAARRDGGLMPARALLAWIESLFPGDIIKVFDLAIEHLKSISFAYLQAERAKLQQTIALAASPVEIQRATAAAVAVPTGFVEKEKWTWELVDAAQVPRDYWVLDSARLDREAKKMKGNLAVAGIKPKRDTSLSRAARR